jgi:hypothetical protein
MVDWKKKKNVEDIYYYFIAKKQESFLKNHCGTRPIECYSSKKKKNRPTECFECNCRYFSVRESWFNLFLGLS